MFGRIGSGLTPPKYGLRSWWISSTRMRPPPSRRLIQPDPAPHIGSTRTSRSAALSASRSTRPTDELLVAVERVEPLDVAGSFGVGERPARDGARAVDGELRLDDAPGCPAPAAAPVGALTLKPLSTQGLWLAVMTMPAAAPALDDLVGAHLGRHGVAAKATGMSWASRTSAAAAAKCSEANRRS